MSRKMGFVTWLKGRLTRFKARLARTQGKMNRMAQNICSENQRARNSLCLQRQQRKQPTLAL